MQVVRAGHRRLDAATLTLRRPSVLPLATKFTDLSFSLRNRSLSYQMPSSAKRASAAGEARNQLEMIEFAAGEDNMTGQWRNVEWQIEAMPDGKLPLEGVTNALLMDIRALLHQMKSMLVFFTVLAVVSLVLGVLSVLITAASHVR